MKYFLIIIYLSNYSWAQIDSKKNKVNVYYSIPAFLLLDVAPKEGAYRIGYAYEMKNQNEIEFTYANQGFHEHSREEGFKTIHQNFIDGHEVALGFNYFYKPSLSENTKIYFSTMIGYGNAKIKTQGRFPDDFTTYDINTVTLRGGILARKVFTTGWLKGLLVTAGGYIHYLYYNDSKIQSSGKNESLDLISPSLLGGIGYQF